MYINKRTYIKKDKIKLSIELNQQLKDMHPHDGLCSPRDIKLAKDINKFATYLEEIGI